MRDGLAFSSLLLLLLLLVSRSCRSSELVMPMSQKKTLKRGGIFREYSNPPSSQLHLSIYDLAHGRDHHHHWSAADKIGGRSREAHLRRRTEGYDETTAGEWRPRMWVCFCFAFVS